MTEDTVREQLRKDHGVRVINKAEDGTSINVLAAGIYGFTFSPATESPMWATKLPKIFEMHRAADNTVYLLGCLRPEDKAAIATSTVDMEVKLYPETYGDATELVAIPLDRIIPKRRQPSRELGNSIPLAVHPNPARAN